MSENTDTYTLAAQRLTEFMKGKITRKTPERFEILRVVCMIPGIFSIDELQEMMEKKAKFQVSRVTLFNTLRLLEEAKLVIKHTLSRAAHYECCITPHPMVCLVCEQCGLVRKLESSKIENWLSEQKCKQSLRNRCCTSMACAVAVWSRTVSKKGKQIQKQKYRRNEKRKSRCPAGYRFRR